MTLTQIGMEYRASAEPLRRRLRELRIATPESVELCYELNKVGFDLPLDRLDPEECAQILMESVRSDP